MKPHTPARRYLPASLAVLTLVTFAADFGGLVPGYPTWLSLGGVTLPTVVVPTGLLGLAVLADIVGRRGAPERFDSVTAGVAVVALLLSGYAVVSLNADPGGVFWAGLPAVFFGGVLALLAFVRVGVELVAPAALTRA